jgi:ribosomal protein S18 acetylase RimI-like enzyme
VGRDGEGVVGVVVKVAGVERLDEVVGLFRGYLEFYEVDVVDAGKPREFIEARMRRDESLVLVAEGDGGRAVGMAQVYRTFSSLAMEPVWVLSDLYVAPEGRRTGAGRALLRGVLERAREAGVAGVQLETAFDNRVAQALYESEGFTVEEFRIYFHGLAGE